MGPPQGGCWDSSLDEPWVQGWAERMDSSSPVFCVCSHGQSRRTALKGPPKRPSRGGLLQAQP